MCLGFSKLLGKLEVKYVFIYTKGTFKKKKRKKKRLAKYLSNDANARFLCFCFPDSLYKSICCAYSFELH